VHSGNSSNHRMPWCASDTFPGRGRGPPITSTSRIVWWGARKGSIVSKEVRAPGRPATRGIRVVSMASASVVASRIVDKWWAASAHLQPVAPDCRT
jgi:hypothetical protein